MKRTALIRHLTANECYLLREGRSHSVWVSSDGIETQAVPRHNEIKNQLARQICRSLVIPDPPG